VNIESVMRLIRNNVPTNCRLFALIMIVTPGLMHSQALNMDGQSGVFFQPFADVVAAAKNQFGGTTASVHVVDAGPVAGDYINAGIEEGLGNWLEFGFTRNNHTDGGDPAISPLFNFAGMNIFNVKAKVVGPTRRHKWLPSLAVGGVLRTNDPFVTQLAAHKNATNGDIYGVATKLVNFNGKFAFLLNAGVRGTNAEKYGYGGNATNWQSRWFGAISFPLPIKNRIVISPTFEIDQEPDRLKYVPIASVPGDLIYAVRLSRYPDSRWSFDVGTGHVGATLAPGINVKANNAVAFAVDYLFQGER
jgi:hypothetical protein